jgi:type II secretory pathway pseudopilin PulG
MKINSLKFGVPPVRLDHWRAGRGWKASLPVSQIGKDGFHSVPLVRSSAFTLVEMILAIVIALGILVVLLFFYQQSTNLRTQILEQTERIAAVRLIMDRITGELRAMQAAPDSLPGFIGSSNSIQFVRADVPSFSSWTGGALGRSAFPVTDLKLVRYRLESVDLTNVAGLVRSEEPLVKGMFDPGAEEETREGPDEVATSTNAVQTADSTRTSSAPVIEQIRFVQFRYWGGTNWTDAWSGAGFPTAVEVTLGAEVAPEIVEEEPEDQPEVFRRVIYVAGVAASPIEPVSVAPPSGSPGGQPQEEGP